MAAYSNVVLQQHVAAASNTFGKTLTEPCKHLQRMKHAETVTFKQTPGCLP